MKISNALYCLRRIFTDPAAAKAAGWLWRAPLLLDRKAKHQSRCFDNWIIGVIDIYCCEVVAWLPRACVRSFSILKLAILPEAQRLYARLLERITSLCGSLEIPGSRTSALLYAIPDYTCLGNVCLELNVAKATPGTPSTAKFDRCVQYACVAVAQ